MTRLLILALLLAALDPAPQWRLLWRPDGTPPAVRVDGGEAWAMCAGPPGEGQWCAVTAQGPWRALWVDGVAVSRVVYLPGVMR